MCTSKSACRSTEFHAVGVKTELRALKYTHSYLADSPQALRSSQAGEHWVPVYSLRSWMSVPPCPSLGPRLRQGNCSLVSRYHVGQSHLVFFCTILFFCNLCSRGSTGWGCQCPSTSSSSSCETGTWPVWQQILLEDAIALPSLLSALPFLHSSPSSHTPSFSSPSYPIFGDPHKAIVLGVHICGREKFHTEQLQWGPQLHKPALGICSCMTMSCTCQLEHWCSGTCMTE